MRPSDIIRTDHRDTCDGCCDSYVATLGELRNVAPVPEPLIWWVREMRLALPRLRGALAVVRPACWEGVG